MRISVIAWGGNGDVLPMLALAKGLRAAGHDLTACMPGRYEAAAKERGLRFLPLGPDPDRMLDAPDLQSALSSTSGIAALRSIGRLSNIMAKEWIAGSLPATEKADLIMGGLVPGFFIGPSLSEKSGAPFLLCSLLPLTPTRFNPTFALFLVRDLGPFLNRLTHISTIHLLWNVLLPAVNRARSELLRLPPAPRRGWFLSHLAQSKPVLYGFSRHVIPPPADWEPSSHVTGYWFLDPPSEYTPPADLAAFLDAGPPPVVIGFGSMTGRRSEEWLRISLEALRLSTRRGIILAGTAPVEEIGRSNDVFITDFVPHTWLYGRVAAAVHHGGAGTTAASLRAGIPAVVVPHNFDQPFWGDRVARLGAGPPPILRRNLTAENLASAVGRVLTDESIRRRAAALGELIRAEDGVAEAVKFIGSL
jgi:UDP:flavonoid glycosyltransferase YjiC (YdhE family)